MLTTLWIENFAIVAQLELMFEHGMTAFTGETGAGKSIMIDALMLALGGRADPSIIRPGAEKCDITACFQIDPGTEQTNWLKEHDLIGDTDEVILRRVLYTTGRSKSYINGQPFPLQKLKEISAMLVDIHGQHQHQSLLQHQTHRDQLDHYANHESLLETVKQHYQRIQQLDRQLRDLAEDETSDEYKALLQYQIQELDELNLQPDEFQTLHEEHQRLHHTNDYLTVCQEMLTRLSDDEEYSIIKQLNQLLRSLSELPKISQDIDNTSELLNNALIQCEEACNEIKELSQKTQPNPERLLEIETRLSLLHQTARKHQVEPHALLEHANELQEKFQQLTSAADKKTNLEQAREEVLVDYHKATERLRLAREKNAPKLAKEITALIQQLGMPKGFIEIVITPLEGLHVYGNDKVEYHVCTNPGLTPNSLAKIASGGELSRISLAIQMITARKGATPTLLFDEIDVGIGGATAALVGQMLRRLSQRLQLFCVTHQPQVASSAHHHFKVEKHIENMQTFSSVLKLTDEEKVNEIARMLGGIKITKQTQSHAQEMLEAVD